MAGYNEQATVALNVVPGTLSGITAVASGMSSLTDTFDSFGHNISRGFGMIDTTLASLGVLAGVGLAKAVDAAGDYEYQMKTVQVISQQSGQAMDELGAKASELSAIYSTSFNKIAEGLQTLGRAGLNNVNTQAEVLTQGLQTAQLEGTNLNTTLETLVQTTALLGGNIDSLNFDEQTKYVNDLMVGTSMAAPLEVSDVAQTLQYSGGMAAVAGANLEDKDMLEDYMGAIAAFAQKGVTGSVAGTALRAFFNKSANQDSSVTEALSTLQLSSDALWEEGGDKMKPVSEQIGLIQKQMDKLNLSTYEQVEIWSKIVGGKMGQQMLKLEAGDIKEMTNKIRENEGTEAAANKLFDTYEMQLERLKTQSSNTFREIGEHGLRYVNVFLGFINNIGGVLQNPYITGAIFIGGLRLISAGLSAAKRIIVSVIQAIRELNQNVATTAAGVKSINAGLGQTELKAQGAGKALKGVNQGSAAKQKWSAKSGQTQSGTQQARMGQSTLFASTIKDINKISGRLNSLSGQTSAVVDSLNKKISAAFKAVEAAGVSAAKKIEAAFSAINADTQGKTKGKGKGGGKSSQHEGVTQSKTMREWRGLWLVDDEYAKIEEFEKKANQYTTRKISDRNTGEYVLKKAALQYAKEGVDIRDMLAGRTVRAVGLDDEELVKTHKGMIDEAKAKHAEFASKRFLLNENAAPISSELSEKERLTRNLQASGRYGYSYYRDLEALKENSWRYYSNGKYMGGEQVGQMPGSNVLPPEIRKYVDEQERIEDQARRAKFNPRNNPIPPDVLAKANAAAEAQTAFLKTFKSFDDELAANKNVFTKLRAKVNNFTSKLSMQEPGYNYSYTPYAGKWVGEGEDRTRVSGTVGSFQAWTSGSMSFKEAMQNSFIAPIKNFGSQLKSSFKKGGPLGVMKTGLSGVGKGLTNLTSLLGGPVMAAFMGIELAVTAVSEAYNDYNKRLQEAETKRAEASDRRDKAEESVLDDLVGDNADITEEEKQTLLDEKYAELYDAMETGHISALDENTLALYAATSAYRQANEQQADIATSGAFSQLKGENFGDIDGFATWFSDSMGAIGADIFGAEGYFDNMSGVRTASQRGEDYSFGTDDASLLAADAMQNGVHEGLRQFYGSDWDHRSKSSGTLTSNTWGLGQWYKSQGGADWALRQNMGILNNDKRTQQQKGALLLSMKNDGPLWKRLGKQIFQYEKKYGKGSFNKALTKPLNKMNKDDKALLNSVKRLQQSIGAKIDYQTILAAASLQQYAEMLKVTQEQIQPTLAQSLETGHGIYSATSSAAQGALSSSSGAAGAAANAAAIAAMLGAQMQEDAYGHAAQDLKAEYGSKGQMISDDAAQAAVRSGSAVGGVSAKDAKRFQQSAVKEYAFLAESIVAPEAGLDQKKKSADKYYNLVKDSKAGSDAQMATLWKRAQPALQKQILSTYEQSLNAPSEMGEAGEEVEGEEVEVEVQVKKTLTPEKRKNHVLI